MMKNNGQRSTDKSVTQRNSQEGGGNKLQLKPGVNVLDNPVYQKMPFYPFKDSLMWQEVEAQQRQSFIA